MLRVGIYARVSTLDQQTLPMQIGALREYAAKRDWAVVTQVKEVGSGAAARQLRQQLIDAARRRGIDARARAGRSGSCMSTRQAVGPAAIGGSSGDRGTEAVPSRLQQIRNRPTAGHRPHLGAPIPGGIFLPDITCCLTALGLGAHRGALIRGLPRGYIPRWHMPARRLTQACRKDTDGAGNRGSF